MFSADSGTTGKRRIHLWNPGVATLLSIPFTPAFGAYHHAKNWDEIGNPLLAYANRVFFFTELGVIACSVMVNILMTTLNASILSLVLSVIQLTLFLLWLFALAIPHGSFVDRKYGDRYQKRSWAGSLTVVLFVYPLVIVSTVIGGLAAQNRNGNIIPSLIANNQQQPGAASPMPANSAGESSIQAATDASIADLKSTDLGRRLAAFQAIAARNSSDDIPLLNESIETWPRDRVLQSQAILILASRKDDRSIDTIVRKVAVCCPAAQEALQTNYGGKAEGALLRELQNSRDSDYTRRLADALGLVGSAASLPALAKLIDHSYLPARMAGAEAIRNIKSRTLAQSTEQKPPPPTAPAAIPQDQEPQKHVRAERPKVEPSSINENDLISSDVNQRLAAFKAVAQRGSPDDIPRLIASLDSWPKDPFRLGDAVTALAATKDDRVILPIARKVAVCYPKAQNALRDNFGSAAEPVLLDELKTATDDEYIRRLADALGELGTSKSIPALAKLHNHSYGMARVAGDWGINKIKQREKK